MNIKIIATSTLAILAVVVLLSIVGYTTTADPALLEFAGKSFGWVVTGVIFVTLLINLPRFLR